MRWWFLLFCSAGCVCGGPEAVRLKGDGFTVEVVPAPFSMKIVGVDGKTRLETRHGPRVTLDTYVIEPQLVPGWDGYRPKERPWRLFDTGVLESSDEKNATLTFKDELGSVRLTLQIVGARLRWTQSSDDGKNSNTSGLGFVMPDGAHYFGMGQRTATFDHLGQSLYSWPEEGGLGAGEDAGPSATNPYPNGPSMTYFPVPFFHTTHGVSVWLASDFRNTVHFGNLADEPKTVRLVANETSMAVTFYVRDLPLQAIDDFTADTGRPLVPPDWAYGPRRRINRDAMVDGVPEWQAMRDRRLPITTVEDAMHVLPNGAQRGLEPELKAWTSVLHTNGFKVFAYNNPYVSRSSSRSVDDYNVGADAGFFERLPDGGPATTFFISGGPQTVSAIDLTNPDAVRWFHSLLGRSIELGYDGWMHDFGEYVARDSRFFDGSTGASMHNRYPVLSAKAAFEFLNGTDRMTFTRSGYTGSQAYVYDAWGGDPEASFDETLGLPSSLRGGLSLSMVGVPAWSSDIGGFKCLTDAPHDKEMLVRWYQMSVMSPMMHEQDACSNPVGGARTKARLWDDVETQDLYREAAGLHTRLAPYFRTLARQSNLNGAPITRAPVLLFPSMPETWTLDDAFFVGPSLYAAPVVRRGVRERRVWLPPGRFVEWTEGTVHEGPGFVVVPAPLSRLPLFIVENQLVPLLDAEVQTLAPSNVPGVVTEASRADVLDVVAALGPGGFASMTLADGTSLEVRRGSKTSASCPACSVETFGAVKRVRLTGVAAFDDVTVSSTGPKTIRWQVLELP
ncbi:MAG: glycoside hydrolase family 31 protein [Myxococcales bacterium]|nr:glycoside hydrolase family 31 protein [Myxococcales bacterium]